MARLDIATRRTQLIDAAMRIALRDGLDNTTVRRIASEAGVSLGTVHYCFESKSALLEAVVESLVAAEMPIAALDLTEDTPPAEVIKAAFHFYWALNGAHADRQRLIYELVAYLVRQDDSGLALARRIFKRNYDLIASYIDAFGFRWDISGGGNEVISQLTMAVVDGVALAWLATQDNDQAIQVLDTFAEMLAAQIKP